MCLSLHRWNKVLRPGLHKGPWTEEEDAVVREMVMSHGVGNVKVTPGDPQRWRESKKARLCSA